jgi:hemerythrin-like domain-containing protein
MRPTEILSSEHRVIEQVLDCLEAMVKGLRAGKPLEEERAATALYFLRQFADACHHGKEEERLFPMLVARGMARHLGPIAVMLDDHRAGRMHLGQAAAALEARDHEGFARAASGYVMLLREHIGKEDGVLFPMAESMLDENARQSLAESFRGFEEQLGPGVYAGLRAGADELARHFGVPLAEQRGFAAPPRGCGHGCP